MSQLAIALLGPPQITLDGAPVSFDTRKAVALLAYLASTRRSHSREALAALLWPEYADARNGLRRTLSTIQRVLGTGWLELAHDQVALAARPELALDVAVFEAALTMATDRGALSAALAVRRDDFLAGFTLRDSPAFDEWQFFEAERLRQRYASALERLAALQLAAGDHAAAIDAARRWLALDALHEPAHQLLMRLYASAGQRSAALRQYRECARVLELELGVAPADETRQLFEAIRTAPTAPVTATPALQPLRPVLAAEPEQLVGRDSERARLRAVYASAQTGALAAIEGPGGVGKTRLAEDLLLAARAAGAPTVSARCYQGEVGLAYAPLAALLRAATAVLERAGRLGDLPRDQLAEAARLVPALARRIDLPEAPPLAGSDGRRRFFEAVTDLLLDSCAGPAPGVLLVDDAHWADHASLDLLAFIARQLRGRPGLLLLAWRAEEVPPDHPLRALLAEARRAGALEQIALGGLPLAAVKLIARTRRAAAPPDLVARLHRESEGLPLLVVEYLEALEAGALAATAEPWPLRGSARDLMTARLHALSEPARRLLLAAATIGRSFDVATLGAAAALAEETVVDGLDELAARGVIAEADPTGVRYDFSHGKLREVALEDASHARQRLVHRRIAQYLAELPGSALRPGVAAQIAYHYGAAGTAMLAAEYHRRAGDEARALYANGAALTHYAAALAAGHPDVTVLHELMGDLHALGGDYQAALDHYETAHAADEPNPRIERKLGEIDHRLGNWTSAETHFAAALAASDADHAERAQTLAAWSLTARRRGDLTRARELADQAIHVAAQSDDPRVLARAHGAAGTVAAAQGERAAARAQLERGLALAEQLDDPETRVAALNSLALDLADDNPARAIGLANLALALCLTRDDRHRAAALHNTLADLHHAIGERERALNHLREAVALFAAIGHDQPAIWMLTEW